ncbi:PAS domain S-box protein [Paenibacillus sp. YN15]|uniref:PAS domain S-box protein n=1 Tax=Paenibacillus sp. YN15 TaxID=1742774 RepID=UPI0015EBC9A9|nr:PAS domain S-box protein [Paenibacillus sp. YN15]
MEPNSSVHSEHCDQQVFMRKWNSSSLFHPQSAPVFLLNPQGEFIQANFKFKEVFGAQIIGRHYHEVMHEEDISRADEIFLRTLKGETVTADGMEFQCPEGVRFYQITTMPMFEGEVVNGVFCIVLDVTEHKMAEEALRRSEAALRLSLHIAGLGKWEWDIRHKSIHLSEEMYVILGLPQDSTKEEIFACWERVHPEDLAQFNLTMKRLLEGHPSSVRLRYHHPDGSVRHLEMMGELLSDERIRINRLIVTTRDITETVENEEKLRNSEELYRLISENSQDFITLSDANGCIYYVSPGVRHLLGYEPEEMMGKQRSFYYHPEHRKDAEMPPGKDMHIATVRCLHKNGHYVWIEVSTKLVCDEKGNMTKQLGIGRDMTDRMAAEEIVLRSEKLTLTGQLAAGIAHEIRNPLTAIKGFLQLLDGGFPLRKDHVAVMSSELMRIESILNELLLLAKPHELKFYQRDVNQIIHQVVTLMETEANMKNVVLSFWPWEGSIPVACDENQLKQVFINFIKNGMESMPDGGELYVHTEIRDQKALVTFKDFGTGIPEDVLARIGQPFLTTKEKGTGLGLAVSFSIIENHNGTVMVKSELGKGTVFTVQLPLAK